MPKAIWRGAVLAESQTTELVEGNHYFPPDSIKRQYFKDSSTHTTCGWKGVASYYDIEEIKGVGSLFLALARSAVRGGRG